MSGVLAVGDMHLKQTVILPLVDQALQTVEVDTIVLMGDYLDEWNQNVNVDRYEDEMSYLVQWVKKKRESMTVICLLGNHDLPYLTQNYRYYSAPLLEIQRAMTGYLEALEPRLYFQAGEWLFTHAGAVGQGELPFAIFDDLQFGTAETKKLLFELEDTIDTARGGDAEYGSIVWADYHYSLLTQANPNYPKQIVGHSPVSNIDEWMDLIDVDTFSLTRDGQPIGDGSLLFIDGDTRQVIPTSYQEDILSHEF
ncbi:hypothetical protein BAU15_00665 [Enterococcus sp. JM4C]|uniref:metallophosphoesterase n=1 Tax=Candidatus Enterococcus huntleyi TaxID=1857217 RepID=UPI001379C526|nr:metallophosphoesterase [Enterococcus sp. JM4C]KAF1299191.1 hypothetical protein BAU15_00665 [Enterococcus sp. JM4C]